MKTMHLFKQYFIIFILLFIFVGYMSKAFISSAYTPISNAEVISNSPKIEILEAKTTNMNGFLIAKITNDTQNYIDNKYIKLDFFSKHDNNIGTKYLKINNLDIEESKEFKLDYRYEGVKKIKGELIEELPEVKGISFNYELSSTDKLALTLGGLIITYYMPVGFMFKFFPI